MRGLASPLALRLIGNVFSLLPGTFAVTSIMTAEAIDAIIAQETEAKPIATSEVDSYEDIELRVQLALTLSLLTGIIQVSWGSCRVAR